MSVWYVCVCVSVCVCMGFTPWCTSMVVYALQHWEYWPQTQKFYIYFKVYMKGSPISQLAHDGKKPPTYLVGKTV